MKPFLILSFALTVVASQAQTFFSTLGPGDSYIQNIGRAISGANNSITQLHGEWGWQFSAGATGLVRQIKVGAHHLTGANEAIIRIHANGAGDTMGTILGTYQFGNMAPFNTTAPVIQIGIANPTVQLNQGTKYWISMAPTSLDTYAAWNDCDTNQFGRMSVSSDGVNYSYVNNMPFSAFEMSAVPEPSTLAAFGLFAMILNRRRRR
ncbi:MAG: PEP-CTERM sorting domain-containing protein [Fimbriimonadaceae bacterium]